MFGGALGSISRAIIQRMVQRFTRWPGWVAILIVNVIGSFCIGLVVSFISKDLKLISILNTPQAAVGLDSFELNELRIFLAVGFCGAFTTFSDLCPLNLRQKRRRADTVRHISGIQGETRNRTCLKSAQASTIG